MAERSKQSSSRGRSSNPRHRGDGHGDLLKVVDRHERQPPRPPVRHPETCPTAKSDPNHDVSSQDGNQPGTTAASQPDGPPAVLHCFSGPPNLDPDPANLGSAPAHLFCPPAAAASDGCRRLAGNAAKGPVGCSARSTATAKVINSNYILLWQGVQCHLYSLPRA